MSAALEIALAAAREHGLARITELRLEVGALSGVSCEALQFAWDFVRAGDELTRAATLDIAHVGGAGTCPQCSFSGPVDSPLRICPQCGALGLQLTAGLQFNVLGISGE